MSVSTASRESDSPFLGSYLPTGDRHDEVFDRDGTVRPHWAYLVRALQTLGAEEFARRSREARRLLRESGVTYNVYDDPQPGERPWPLDPMPMLVTSADWQTIERGLAQRAELLDAVLADLYGERSLVQSGLLPPELVYGHPGFLRPCVGVPTPGRRSLPFYAADIARGPDGSFLVLGDRTQAPSGAGYALENRAVLSRILPSIFRDAHVHRLPLFFRRLRAAVAGLLPRTDGPPHCVLLTPGAGNETYFEHAFLAEHLGFNLAQGDDLTVRDGRVWLRTLEGLRAVDVILRRVDGAYCDPLELNVDSLLGTPGLLHAARQGSVAIVNPPGASVVENPGLMPFLPRLARELLGEDLLLPSVRTWWCGNAEDRAFVFENLSRLVVKPIESHSSRMTVFAADLSAEERASVMARIRERPHRFVAQERVALSTAPVVAGGVLEPRAMVLRAFLVGESDGYAVMPGALCRVTPTAGGSVVSNQQGGVSKDVWVLASEPEREMSVLTPADRPLLLLRGGQEIAGRVADNLFWLGRYAARAENGARILRAAFRRLVDPDGDEPLRAALLRAVTEVTATYPGFAGIGAAERIATAEVELLAVLSDGRRTGSVRFNLNASLRAARGVRDRLSVDMWRVLGELEHELSAPPAGSEALDAIERLLLFLAAFSGLGGDSMNRGLGWRFLEMGRHVERASGLLTLLRALAAAQAGEGAWEELLAIADVSMAYRRRYRSGAQAAAVLDLLLDDESNPRSVFHQILRLEALLSGLAAGEGARGPEQRLVGEARDELRRSGALAGGVPRQPGVELDALLLGLQRLLAALSEQVARTYFDRPDGPQQLVSLTA
jgi:uncharacterized circularly permuted ATP-grasp superfamily protein/uncharacterized alpha-E superfamily protein